MSATENITVVKGSYGYRLNFTLVDSTGTARDMSGYSIKLQMWAPLVPGTLLLDKAMGWTLDTAGTCYYDVVTTDFDTVGVFAYAIKTYVSTTIIDTVLSGFITVTQYGGSYCTLEEVKSELDIKDNLKDDIIQRSIEQVRVFIDNYCDRTFTSTAATRYFDGDTSPLKIDDLALITGTGNGIWLDEDGDGTYESAMATTDYILYPYNVTPKTKVLISNDSDYGGFAAGITQGVKIIGTWGYTTVPEPIRRAALIQVNRWFKRRETAYADVLGSAEFGTITTYKGLDPDIKEILKPYIRLRY